MAERKRNKEIHFYVTEEERKLIRRKMIESKTKNMGAYLRKMAIDGYIVNTDTTLSPFTGSQLQPVVCLFNNRHHVGWTNITSKTFLTNLLIYIRIYVISAAHTFPASYLLRFKIISILPQKKG